MQTHTSIEEANIANHADLLECCISTGSTSMHYNKEKRYKNPFVHVPISQLLVKGSPKYSKVLRLATARICMKVSQARHPVTNSLKYDCSGCSYFQPEL